MNATIEIITGTAATENILSNNLFVLLKYFLPNQKYRNKVAIVNMQINIQFSIKEYDFIR